MNKYLLDNYTGKIAKPSTVFSLKQEGRVLIFEFVTNESSLTSFSKINNDTLYEDNVVEVFLDLGDDFYYEFEVAPNGATFVAKIKNWNIEFFDCEFFSATSEIINNGYHVIMKIDLEKINDPKIIKYNAFRIEVDEKKNACLQALSPTFCDTFHKKEKFISL